MKSLTAPEIRNFFNLQTTMHAMAGMAQEALAQHHINPKSWDHKVLKEGFIAGLSIEGDTIHVEIEYSSQTGVDTHLMQIPVLVAAECGFDAQKWDAWAKEQLAQEQQRLAEAERVRSEEAARQKREGDIATLLALQAQYPEVE